MNNYCAFSKDHKCLKWDDYEHTRHELEEADDLCHGNQIEIQWLYTYINGKRQIKNGPIEKNHAHQGGHVLLFIYAEGLTLTFFF